MMPRSNQRNSVILIWGEQSIEQGIIKGAVPDQTAREPRGEHLPSSSLL